MFARPALLISIIQAALLLGSVEARIWLLERDGRVLFARRFGQAQPAVLKDIASACGGGVCDALADEAVAPLLAAQPECAQQDMADKIIDASRQFDAATQDKMVAAAVKYRQAERNTPPDLSTSPPILRNSVFCQKAPENSELDGLVQAQDPANDPNFFYDPATGATVSRGSQLNTFPFGTNVPSPSDQIRLASRSMMDGNNSTSEDGNGGDKMGGNQKNGGNSDDDKSGDSDNMMGGNDKNDKNGGSSDKGGKGGDKKGSKKHGNMKNGKDGDNKKGGNLKHNGGGKNQTVDCNINNGTDLTDGNSNNGTDLTDGNINNGTDLSGNCNNGTDLTGGNNNNGTDLTGGNSNNGTDLTDGNVNNGTDLTDGNANNGTDLTGSCSTNNVTSGNDGSNNNVTNGNDGSNNNTTSGNDGGNNNTTNVIDGNNSTTNGTVDAGNIGNFGSCSVPQIEFGAGFDGRRETAFQPVDKVSYNHGSAQNIGVITQFMCDQLVNTCGADATAKSTCAKAKTAADGAPPKTGQQADAFNAVFGNTTNFANVTPLDDNGNPVAARRSLRRSLLGLLKRVESYLEDA